MDGIDPAWAWVCAGLALGAAEILVPGYFLIWVGMAALATGVLTLASGVGTVPQLGLFTVVTILSVLAARRWTHEAPAEESALNDPAARLIDSIVTVVETVNAEHGRVRVADGTWPARGDPARPGDKVRIVAVEDGWLIVTRRRRSGQARGNR